MTFTSTASGVTVTAGTEELSGMAGVSSGVVTVDTSNYLPIYNISQRITVDQGATLTITTKGIYNFANIGGNIRVGIDSGTAGNLIIGTDNGDNSPIEIVITTQRNQGDPFAPDSGIFDIRGDSNIFLYGIALFGRVGLGFRSQPVDNGQLVARNIKWDATGSGEDFIRILGDDWDSVNTHFIGKSLFPARGFTQIKDALITDTSTGITMNWGGDCLYLNYVLEGLTFERISGRGVYIGTNANKPRGSVIEFLNGDSLTTGTENLIEPREGRWNSNRSKGTVIKTSDLDVNITDFVTSAPLDFKFYAIDNDSGNRTPSVIGDNEVSEQDGSLVRHHYDVDIVIDEDVAGGQYNGKIVKTVFSRPQSQFVSAPAVGPVWDVRLPISWGVFKYGYLAKTGQFTGNITGKQVLNLALDPQSLITQTDKSIVDAYTEIETPQKLFDRMESFREDNYAGSANPFIGREGNTIDAGIFDVVIDATSSPAFAFDGSTITINATTFTGNITTTGTVSFANGASIVGGIVDSNGDSFLTFTGVDNWEVYASQADANIQANLLGSGTSIETYRFTFSPATTYYLRLMAGEDTLFKTTTPTQSGETTVELTIAGLLTALPANVDKAVTSSIDGVDLVGAVATGVEDAILDDSDGQAVIAAIVNAIGNTNLDEVALVAAIRSDLERAGGSLDLILEDTADLQANQGNWLTAIGFSTFDPANDAVANVTLVDTVTTNTDMRGTDGANTVAPDNASITAILADTNDLQTNQGNWLTATGFSTFDALTDNVTVGTNNDKTDYELANNSITSSTIENNAFNNSAFTTGFYNSINSEVDTALEDYDAPTKAELDTAQTAIIEQIDANETKLDTITANVSAIPTTDSVADLTPVLTAISNLNDISSSDVTSAVPSAAQIEAALLNEGDGQQLIDAIVQAIDNTNVSEAALVAAIRSDLERSGGSLDLLPLLSEIEASTVLAKGSDILGLNDITANQVVTAMQAVADDFKADTSNLETISQSDSKQALLIAEHNATQSAISLIENYDDTDLVSKIDDVTSIADEILIDTNDLQSSQGNWLTATGFATPSDTVDAQNAIITEIDNNEAKIDTVLTDIGNIDIASINSNLTVINDGVKKASLFIPHTEDL